MRPVRSMLTRCVMYQSFCLVCVFLLFIYFFSPQNEPKKWARERERRVFFICFPSDWTHFHESAISQIFCCFVLFIKRLELRHSILFAAFRSGVGGNRECEFLVLYIALTNKLHFYCYSFSSCY